ncbi:MAG: alginate export family protein [Pseudomonadota bacterium]
MSKLRFFKAALFATSAISFATPTAARIALENVRYSATDDHLRVVFDLDAPPTGGDIAIEAGAIRLNADARSAEAIRNAARLPESYLAAVDDKASPQLSFILSPDVTIERSFEIADDGTTGNHRVVVDLARTKTLREGPAPMTVAALDAGEIAGVRVVEEKAGAEELRSEDLARVLGVSNDDVRPDDQLKINLFGAPLIVGGELEAAAQSQSNYDLDRRSKDYRLRTLPEAKIEALFLPSENVAAFVQAKAFVESEIIDADGSDTTQAGASLDQAWVFVSKIFGLNASLQVGRQKFQDRREWWWDDDFEAVRLHFASGRFFGFIAAGEELWSADTLEPLQGDQRDRRHVLGNLAYTIDPKKQLELFFLNTNDHSGGYGAGELVADGLEDESDADLTWIGVRYRGRHKFDPLGKIYFNLDLARVAGDETLIDFQDPEDDGLLAASAPLATKVRGWAIDTSVNWEMPFDFEPYLSLGYARGSGDRDETDGVDRDFRQTGLHGNNGKNRGISRFRYYGEVLRPDLSNMQVFTGAIGVPLGETMWLETVYHQYRQTTPRDEISASRLDFDPLGISRDIGREIDAVLSFEYRQRWEAEITLGAFEAGDAFGPAKGEWAHGAAFKLNYNF